jgi:oxygen-independent coproporphyrinogen-3 oxidase
MLGLYIHIPFCKRKCPYCDFVSYDNFDYLIDDYINTLFNELQIYKKKFNPFFETVYIGGGTPSILSNKQLKKFFSKLFSIVERAKIKEITFEVNPGTLDDDKIKIISENINRVSVGVQSFNDDILKFIGRIHNSKEIFLTFDKLKKSGIKNINMDLMFGIPHQTVNDVLNDIKNLGALSPEHISFYLFTISDDKFKGEKLPDDKTIKEMYLKGIKELRKNGYLQYEISNFAKKNKKCMHNMNYWNCGEYIGIGVSAASYFNGVRYENTDNVKEYIEKIKKGLSVIKNKEKITDKIKLKEYIMLKLRTKDGIKNDDFIKNFKFDFLKKYSNIIEKLKKEKLAKIKDNKFFLTEKGFLLSNEIIKNFW